MRDERDARLNLLGVIVCAAVSTFANAAASLQGYNATNLNHTPWWMQQVAPWLGTVFPTMIIVLSLTTDHLLDHRGPSKSINLDTYKAQEQRRVDMLQIKLDTEKALLTLDKELSLLRGKRGLASGHRPREWFFVRWLRPVIPPTQEVVTEQIGQAVDALRQALDTQIGQVQTLVTTVDVHLKHMDIRLNQLVEQTGHHEETLDTLRKQLSDLSTQTTEVTTHLDTLDSQVSTLATRRQARSVQANNQVNTISAQMGSSVDTTPLQEYMNGVKVSPGANQMDGLPEQVDALDGQASNEHQQHSRRAITLDTFRKEKNGTQRTGDFEERILLARQTLGPGASNRQIARLLNCSPTTVSRWLSQSEQTQQELA